ncbi:glucose-1-phosphate adenylyltransferase [Paenibacillus cremeus]|uniref:Glucose-1-phosphate adenylyltransferase n=1 Tax=Paenibacillus cremeus TaxID=2163881 RepID=A0A559KHR0_9BACL|nr:glucose-1-phosphate adenylyltransferase [Paenibacillus cremeus]TVY11675.1 glucose-1-phosphate adenylyltransferase [Paenibacillus cremeus]
MRKKECVAMLLAGGEGRRLGLLTNKLAKPAVHFGGKYRIIDFTLSNCTNSGIDTVGVLTQYQPLVLNTYIGIGTPWDLDRKNGGVTVLPPFMEQSGGDWYKGTANAIYRNISFIEQYDPEYVLIISGDHIYKMDYDKMLDFHKRKNADATIAVIEVKWEEASRFGIMSTDDEDRITEFAEKPKEPKSNLASMGIYIFNWKALKENLIIDEEDPNSSKDFGKDLIPRMLRDGRGMFAYPFEGYWKDVGTIQSLWEANMDLLEVEPEFNLNDREWRIYSVNPCQPGQYVSSTAQVRRSLVNEGCCVFGEIDHSVLFYGVEVGEGSLIKDSVIMPNVSIGKNVKIYKSIIGEGTVVDDGCVIGAPEEDGPQDIILIGGNEHISLTTSSAAKG